jgi:predicted amidohydrolase
MRSPRLRRSDPLTARVAAVQPQAFAGEEEYRNAAQACAWIDSAADAGAGYVVFPEGYPGPYSGPMENDAMERLREQARARRVWVSARAAENLVYVVVTQNLFGASRRGRACIASPERMLAQRDDPGILIADLDLTRLDAIRSRYYDEELLSPPRQNEEILGCRPGQSHDRRPELYAELTRPQSDAFTYHYERRGLDTWREEYQKVKENPDDR